MRNFSLADMLFFFKQHVFRKITFVKNNKDEHIIFCHIKLPCHCLGPDSITKIEINKPNMLIHNAYKKGLYFSIFGFNMMLKNGRVYENKNIMGKYQAGIQYK